MVAQSEDNGTEDNSPWCTGLNQSIYYTSDATAAMIYDQNRQLPERQSDLYTDIFGDAANDNNKDIREIRGKAHNKLRDTLGNATAQTFLDKRRTQLDEVVTKARNIRDKMDQAWVWANGAKKMINVTVGAWMFKQGEKEIAFYFGIRPETGTILTPPPDSYRLGGTIISGITSLPLAMATAWGTDMAMRKGFDWFPPEHFFGLDESRKEIAEMAENFRELSENAKITRDDTNVAEALVQEYGKDGHQVLGILMNITDYFAYNYMRALQSKPFRFMRADDHLKESGVTSASLLLLHALVEEARFINAFGKNNQPVVKKVCLNNKYPTRHVVLKVMAPSKGNAQSSSQAQHKERAKVNFNAVKYWDYSTDWKKLLEHLESRVRDLSRTKDTPDLKKADQYLIRAKTGDAKFMALLANLCAQGIFQLPDIAETNRIAKQLYTPAADQGDPDAQYRLGLLHKPPAERVGIQDDQTAVDWLTKAADQGHRQAQEELARSDAPITP